MIREENIRMREWLRANGVQARAKYIKDGSLRGSWRLYSPNVTWWDNKELQEKLSKLGFVDLWGDPLDNACGNGGMFSVFLVLTDKYTEMQLRFGTDDRSAIY